MIGQIISHYKIIEKLGVGGMGVVYLAQDIKLKRLVALKFLPPELTLDEEIKKRFIQEAQAASAVDHPNICNIHEIDETADGQMFICMAYYGSETLKSKIAQGALSPEEAINISSQIAQGLGKAHEQGIVHRDIKPANLLITEDGLVKIVDFGLAKLAGQARLTITGKTMGTVAYMSPEQARGERVDHRADIWSLGVVLYEMITGHLPFKGEFEQAVIYSILNEDPESIAAIVPTLPPGLDKIVNKALSKNPDERYQHIDEIEADLEPFGPPAGIPSSRVTDAWYRKKKSRRIIISPAIAIIIALLLLLLKPLIFEQVLFSEPKPIAVIYFENQTGDKTYDYLQKAIPNLLTTSLEQSKYIRVITWERMNDLLKQMGKENVEIIDPDLGFEICRMDNIETIVLGSFTKAGNIFATDVKVLDAKTKALVKSTSSRGKGIASILEKQIDELSREISLGIGISERKIEETQVNIADVTTTSMHAYNYFLRGREDFEKYYYDDALQFLEKAVQIDSTFAVAHLYYAMTYNKLGSTKLRNEAYEKAMAFSEKASDKERLYIEAEYARSIEGDSKKRIRIYELLAKKYPKEKRVHVALAFSYYWSQMNFRKAFKEFSKALKLDPNYGYAMNQLAYVYADMTDYEKAIEYFKKYASVSPGDANPFDSMGEIYLQMGKLGEAIDKFQEAMEVKPDFGISNWKIAYIYALKEDYIEALKWIDRFIAAAESPGVRAEGYIWRGFYSNWLGMVDQAKSELDSAATLTEMVESDWWKAYIDKVKAWVYYGDGEFELGRECRKDWLDYFLHNRPEFKSYFQARYYFYLGLADLKQQRIDTAKSRLIAIESLIADLGTGQVSWIEFRYNLLRREVLIADHTPDKAIAVCKEAQPMRMPVMSSTNMISYLLPCLSDALARAYKQKGQLDLAISEYERLVTFNPESEERGLIHPKYYYRLARLYQERGQEKMSFDQLRKFMNIWKHADNDLPEVIDAKERLAALRAKIGQ